MSQGFGQYVEPLARLVEVGVTGDTCRSTQPRQACGSNESKNASKAKRDQEARTQDRPRALTPLLLAMVDDS